MPDPKLLVLDLDGTTLRRAGGIAPEDIRAVDALKAQGVYVTIATGRLFSGTRPWAQRLGISGTVAAMNGSELWDVATSRVVLGQYLDQASLTTARGIMMREGITPFVFAGDRVVYDPTGAPYLRFVRIWSDEVVCVEDAYDAHAWRVGEAVSALGGVGDEVSVKRAVERLRAVVEDHIEVIWFPLLDGARYFLKVRDRREDKGTALVRIADALDVPVEDTVAIGDWSNDTPMLRAAGQGFLMGGDPGHRWQPPADAVEAADVILDAVAGKGGGIAEVARRVWGVTA